MRNRQYETHLRLNEKEHKKLCELAKKAGVTKSAVLRKLIMGTEVKERPNVDFIDLIQLIDHLCINVNQIAHHANVQGRYHRGRGCGGKTACNGDQKKALLEKGDMDVKKKNKKAVPAYAPQIKTVKQVRAMLKTTEGWDCHEHSTELRNDPSARSEAVRHHSP